MSEGCAFGMAILLINMITPPFLISRPLAGPEICREMARDLTPFALRFHYETPRCLIEIQAVKGDKLR